MLDLVDFGANPHAREFGDFGICRVRYGKARKGSPLKPRSVLTVWDWTTDILQQWTTEVRPLMPEAGSPALWPSERGGRITVSTINKRLTTRLTFKPGVVITQQRRLALLRRFAVDKHADVGTRTAACLLLLYAQPLSRIQHLTTNHVTSHDGELLIHLGDPPAPVPEPFATLLRQLAAAAGPPPALLFPGRLAGQPIAYQTLHNRLRNLGFPITEARVAALRQLVLQAPAPVVADALGFHQTTATRQVSNAGGTWSQYAAGDTRRHPDPGPVGEPATVEYAPLPVVQVRSDAAPPRWASHVRAERCQLAWALDRGSELWLSARSPRSPHPARCSPPRSAWPRSAPIEFGWPAAESTDRPVPRPNSGK
ncbi:hypothetical protein [Micromonospora kangleipakensis]|nr:hypothetical protein [Micromonospora kangleipakensis]